MIFFLQKFVNAREIIGSCSLVGDKEIAITFVLRRKKRFSTDRTSLACFSS